MALSAEQRELLSAHLDGELSNAEQALVKTLLERPEGRDYLAELQRVRGLVAEHGGACAPASLASRVVARISENTNDAASEGPEAPVHRLPTAGWRTPFFAAAAAVTLVGALIIGERWVSPDPDGPSPVAKEDAFRSGESEAPPPVSGREKAVEGADKAHPGKKDLDTWEDEHDGAFRRVAAGGGTDDNAGPEAEEARDAEYPDVTSGAPDAPGAPEVGTPENRTGKGCGARRGANDTRRPASPETTDGGGGGGPTEAFEALDEERDAADKAKEERRICLDRGACTPAELSLVVDRENDSPALMIYNELLRVSALYGEAELRASGIEYDDGAAGSDFSLYEGVEVTLSADDMTDLLEALQRLAGDGDYGDLILPSDIEKTVLARRQAENIGAARDRRLSDYLPLEILERRANRGEMGGAASPGHKAEETGPSADDAEDSRQPAKEAGESTEKSPDTNEHGKTVRIIIRLR